MQLVLLGSVGVVAGLLGALLGVGGGVLLVPALVLGFGVPMDAAVPASLLAVVATSCGAGATYVDRGMADVRLAMTLELCTVAGALIGGVVAGLLAPSLLAWVFSGFVLLVSVQLFREQARNIAVAEPVVHRGRLVLGASGSFVAGGLSALLGVGGGPLKVPLMNLGMGMPFKVASATSNLMIGVTAAASVIAYALRGRLDLHLSSPVVAGVLLGAWVGTRLMPHVPAVFLKRLLGVALLFVAAQMAMKGFSTWPSK